MRNTTRYYPCLSAEPGGDELVAHAGTALLVRTAEATGLTTALSKGLARFRKPLASHDPGKIICDLAIALAAGGDCLADIAALRDTPAIFGRVASDPTVSRMITTLASDADRAESAISGALAAARVTAWAACPDSPDTGVSAADPLVVDLDATLVTAHSDKEQAAPTYKRGYGHHLLCAFVDHGATGTGEPAGMLLRPGNAGSNTADDHVTVIKNVLAQLPVGAGYRGKKILIRIDGAGGSHTLIEYLTRQRLSYSVGFGLTATLAGLVDQVPDAGWTPAYDSEATERDGAWVAELTDMADLSSWPAGMRLIVRKERPHPGAQLRFTDRDGLRLTAFVTNTRRGQLAHLELRHRRRARCEDRIRQAKQTGLENLPLHGFDANRIWCLIVQTAMCLIAWTQQLAFPDHPARRWEVKRLRYRLLSLAGRISRHARRIRLRIGGNRTWTALLDDGLTRLAALAPP